MRQRYHAIIRCHADGLYVGWVEEIPGTITRGHTLEECRQNLRDALKLILETNRDEARRALDPSCITELVDVEVSDEAPVLA